MAFKKQHLYITDFGYAITGDIESHWLFISPTMEICIGENPLWYGFEVYKERIDLSKQEISLYDLITVYLEVLNNE